MLLLLHNINSYTDEYSFIRFHPSVQKRGETLRLSRNAVRKISEGIISTSPCVTRG